MPHLSTAEIRESTRQSRVNCRVNTQIKQQAETAAALLGQSITDFTEAALAEKAQSVLEKHERIVLSQRDFAFFVERIEKPESPTPELQTAMDEYRTLKATCQNANL